MSGCQWVGELANPIQDCTGYIGYPFAQTAFDCVEIFALFTEVSRSQHNYDVLTVLA
jgi:hypothetical protein